MRILPVNVRNLLPSADNGDGLVARSEKPVLPEGIEERRTQLRWLQDQDYYFLERTALDSRVLIIGSLPGRGYTSL